MYYVVPTNKEIKSLLNKHDFYYLNLMNSSITYMVILTSHNSLRIITMSTLYYATNFNKFEKKNINIKSIARIMRCISIGISAHEMDLNRYVNEF